MHSMTHLNIALPESMREFIEEQVADGGYSTPSEYVQALIRNEQKRKAQERLEALLLEGLASGPATPMTDEDWADIRRQVHERLKERGSG
jgi:antitoxin ParD1/3/4